jgi:hypothetical protein
LRLSDKPVQAGLVSGDPEEDSFGLVCPRYIEQPGSITAAVRAQVVQVGMITGDPEKHSFGYVQAANAQ